MHHVLLCCETVSLPLPSLSNPASFHVIPLLQVHVLKHEYPGTSDQAGQVSGAPYCINPLHVYLFINYPGS